MKPKQLTLSVIIPAYNEEDRIGKTIAEVDRFLNQRSDAYEILVVDDGSRDGTREVVRKFAENISEIRLLAHKQNYGKGWAVRTGMLNALGKYRLFMDADGSTAISHWIGLRDSIEMGADVAVGSRHAIGSRIEKKQSLNRVMLGFVFRQFVRELFHMNVHDTQNGFKAFTADAAERIFKRQTVKGWAFDVEILSIAQSLGFSIAEVPVVWIDDSRSKVRALSMPKMLIDILRIHFKDPGSARRAGERPTERIAFADKR